MKTSGVEFLFTKSIAVRGAAVTWRRLLELRCFPYRQNKTASRERTEDGQGRDDSCDGRRWQDWQSR
jgi:hypothetical protein